MLADLPASQRIPDEELRNVTGCQGGMAIGEGKGGEGGAKRIPAFGGRICWEVGNCGKLYEEERTENKI